jgi:hypothetical protein
MTPKASESVKFFKIVQNKLHYAAHGYTAAEVIALRANAGKPFMGLLSFSTGGVSRKDIEIAKNYLDEAESCHRHKNGLFKHKKGL